MAKAIQTIAQRKSRSRLHRQRQGFPLTALLIPLAFGLVELFAFAFLKEEGPLTRDNTWPLVFGLLWTGLLTGIVLVLPGLASRIAFGMLYFLSTVYAVVQTGYFLIFGEMLWLSDFRYASEGSDYLDVLLGFPPLWYAGVAGLLLLGIFLVWKYPRFRVRPLRMICGVLLTALCVRGCLTTPAKVFEQDEAIQYAGSDYGRAQSAQAAYENMFSAHRLYQVCGLLQTGVKDLYTNFLYPLTPGYAEAQTAAKAEIGDYFAQRGDYQSNEMTGIFEGKNVILVLMESMDDWVLGEHTPTINRLMAEGINFTNFYTPGYGSVRTFNSEFCVNTGSFLSSTGGYAFDYVTNHFDQSLAGQLGGLGYSSVVYHYNSPDFYSRGVFSPAMGYDQYLTYEDYVTEENLRDLYDDEFLFNNAEVSDSFFREGPKLNFIITRSAHLSYKYNEVLSYWGLQKYPEYRGLTGHEELDCFYLKAKLVDDLFARLLEELEAKGELENTVIIGVTDHYSYGFKDVELMMEQSGVDHSLLLEKTPCFIWSADGPSLEVTKTLNTADLLPTVLNLLGLDHAYDYLGQDAFDDDYPGYALFPDGSWISQGIARPADQEEAMILEEGAVLTEELDAQMSQIVTDFIRINNLILDTDYYRTQ